MEAGVPFLERRLEMPKSAAEVSLIDLGDQSIAERCSQDPERGPAHRQCLPADPGRKLQQPLPVWRLRSAKGTRDAEEMGYAGLVLLRQGGQHQDLDDAIRPGLRRQNRLYVAGVDLHPGKVPDSSPQARKRLQVTALKTGRSAGRWLASRSARAAIAGGIAPSTASTGSRSPR